MSTRLIAGTIMSAVLLAVVLLLALRGCESPSPGPQEPIQYENTHEETTVVREPSVQYPSELPPTGGIKLYP